MALGTLELGFFKRSNSSTPKNMAIHTKNAALDMGYSHTYKTWLHMNNLSRVFKKRAFISFVAAFLKMRPKTRVFCSESRALIFQNLEKCVALSNHSLNFQTF